MEKMKKIKTVMEVLQWVLLAAIFAVLLFIYPNIKNNIKDERKHQLYQQIDKDLRIDKLTRENQVLYDSIANTKKDTVKLIEFKTIKKIVYVSDTVNK